MDKKDIIKIVGKYLLVIVISIALVWLNRSCIEDKRILIATPH